MGLLKSILPGIAAVLLFPACNGLFEGIYDTPSEEERGEFGFVETDNENNSGAIYIDATSYTRWVYIDFHSQTTESVEIAEDGTCPESWDVAVHRYDAKTNGASVLETGYTGLSTLKAGGKMPEGVYMEDEWTEDKIITDMSGMMQGVFVYESSFYNAELSKWLYVDIGNMPPGYYPSNKVYVVKLKDNSTAAVRLRNFMNTSGAKGYMTIEYIYPLEF